MPVAFQYLDTDSKDVIQLLTDLNNDKGLHEAAGYNAISKLPGLPEGTSRWQTVVNHANHSQAPEELKSLALK